jgi:methylglutaconyl-CoA hydratase
LFLSLKGTGALRGASFDELLAVSDLEEEPNFFGFAHLINAACSKLIIGRIHGKAVGGGVGMHGTITLCYCRCS